MTIEELLARESIRKIIEKYSMAGDEYDEDKYISCFTDDAIMEFDPFPGQGQVRLEGTKAIGEFVASFFGALKSGTVKLPGEFARHHIAMNEIELTGSDTAKAKSYCLVTSKEGLQNTGIYTGTFKKSGDNWLITHRKWTPD